MFTTKPASLAPFHHMINNRLELFYLKFQTLVLLSRQKLGFEDIVKTMRNYLLLIMSLLIYGTKEIHRVSLK